MENNNSQSEQSFLYERLEQNFNNINYLLVKSNKKAKECKEEHEAKIQRISELEKKIQS